MNQIITHSYEPQGGALHNLLRLQRTLTQQLARNQQTCWQEDSLKSLVLQNKRLSRQLRDSRALLKRLCRQDLTSGDISSFEFH
jgi:hypothetical protein